MDKEEIEELKDFTIDLTDIDELALDLEVCSKKIKYGYSRICRYNYSITTTKPKIQRSN